MSFPSDQDETRIGAHGATANLALPNTNLVVTDEAITKHGPGSTVVAAVRLEDVVDVRVENTTDYAFPLVIVLAFAALAVVCRVYVPSPGWAWAGTIVCLGIAAVAAFAINGRRIVIETRDGALAYPVADSYDIADGFVVSLKSQLRSRATDEA